MRAVGALNPSTRPGTAHLWVSGDRAVCGVLVGLPMGHWSIQPRQCRNCLRVLGGASLPAEWAPWCRVVVPAGAPEAVRLAVRREYLGGSDASALFGVDEYRSPQHVWASKIDGDESEPSEPARWGSLLESVIRDEYGRREGVTVRVPGVLVSARWPRIGATPDGVLPDGTGLEIKTASTWKAGDWADDQVADHAELQAQWGMAVTGAARWVVLALIGGQRLECRTVTRNERLINYMVSKATAWWDEHVATGVMPALTASPAVDRFVAQRYPLGDGSTVYVDAEVWADLAARYQTAGQAVKDAEAAHEAVKTELRALAGSAEYVAVVDDQGRERVVATLRNTARFAAGQLRQDHPELATKYTRVVETVDEDGLAADHPDIYRRYRGRQINIKKG